MNLKVNLLVPPPPKCRLNWNGEMDVICKCLWNPNPEVASRVAPMRFPPFPLAIQPLCLCFVPVVSSLSSLGPTGLSSQAPATSSVRIPSSPFSQLKLSNAFRI